MRAISNPLLMARMLLAQNAGWMMFMEIPKKSGTAWYRLVQSSRHVNANAKVWQAASMKIEIPEESTDGDLGQLVVTIGDVSRLALAAVEVENEILGQEVTVWLQHTSNLATFDPALTWTHKALSVDGTPMGIVVTCGHPARIVRVPSRRYTRKSFPQLLPQGGVRR